MPWVSHGLAPLYLVYFTRLSKGGPISWLEVSWHTQQRRRVQSHYPWGHHRRSNYKLVMLSCNATLRPYMTVLPLYGIGCYGDRQFQQTMSEFRAFRHDILEFLHSKGSMSYNYSVPFFQPAWAFRVRSLRLWWRTRHSCLQSRVWSKCYRVFSASFNGITSCTPSRRHESTNYQKPHSLLD